MLAKNTIKYLLILEIESMREKANEEKETKKEANKEINEKTDEKINYINRPNITKIVNLVKNTIYNTLLNYFNFIPNSVLLASILDPRFKKIKGWQKEEKEKAIALLRSEYTFLKNKKHLNHNQNNFKSYLFEKEEKEIINKDEIDHYFKF
ncbi:37786_t:CDS:2 [Gigaspora margarita]|uniref:37786_t:CDS:1 n=1 Tax=Gigaspora margarita TaxID=4874 RepID=A0ABN7UV75_GIGMA|nr:37786_t:CDS:2 [Gigaspora margarita]